MDRSGDNMPAEVEAEAGELIAELHSAGWTVSRSHYDARVFGNWYVDLRRADLTLRLVKDRSQYMVDGLPINEIKAAGLWRAFDDLEDFRHTVVKWATDPNL
jgi:hypothetical protein